MQPALCLQPQPIHLEGFQPHRSWGSFLWHSPSHASRNPCQRSHQRGKLSLSWFSQAWVCGESSLPSPTPPTLCWRSPRTDPSSVAPCRTTSQPSHSCLERVQPCQAAWRVLHPMCFLGERKKMKYHGFAELFSHLEFSWKWLWTKKILRAPCKSRAHVWGRVKCNTLRIIFGEITESGSMALSPRVRELR